MACGMDLPVDPCMCLYHVAVGVVIENTLPTAASKLACKRGIVKKSSEFRRQSVCIARAKRETSVAQDLDEAPQIGCDNRETPQHEFCKN
jgi:hypothetical protein